MLHIYDQRTSNVALRYESVYEVSHSVLFSFMLEGRFALLHIELFQQGLFSHQFLDANLCVLGYDRGWMEVYDIRKNVR